MWWVSSAWISLGVLALVLLLPCLALTSFVRTQQNLSLSLSSLFLLFISFPIQGSKSAHKHLFGASALSSAHSDRENPGGFEGAGNAAGAGDHEERPDPRGGQQRVARHLLREKRERPGSAPPRCGGGWSAPRPCRCSVCVVSARPAGPAAPTPARTLVVVSRRRFSRTSLPALALGGECVRSHF